MIKRLIFDVDNTLITNVNFVDAIKNTLIDLNLYSEERVNDFIKGIGTYEGIYKSYNKTDYTKHMSNHLKVALPDIFLEVFFNHLKYAIPEKNEQLINSISELAKKYELVLLTNYFSKSQMNRLNGMGIGHFFKHCYGEEVIKPYQDAYISACGDHRPDECIMIGDDLYLDIECAKKLGLKTILVNTKNVDVGNIDTIIVSKVEEIDDSLIKTMV